MVNILIWGIYGTLLTKLTYFYKNITLIQGIDQQRVEPVLKYVREWIFLLDGGPEWSISMFLHGYVSGVGCGCPFDERQPIHLAVML